MSFFICAKEGISWLNYSVYASIILNATDYLYTPVNTKQ